MYKVISDGPTGDVSNGTADEYGFDNPQPDAGTNDPKCNSDVDCSPGVKMPFGFDLDDARNWLWTFRDDLPDWLSVEQMLPGFNPDEADFVVRSKDEFQSALDEASPGDEIHIEPKEYDLDFWSYKVNTDRLLIKSEGASFLQDEIGLDQDNRNFDQVEVNGDEVVVTGVNFHGPRPYEYRDDEWENTNDPHLNERKHKSRGLSLEGYNSVALCAESTGWGNGNFAANAPRAGGMLLRAHHAGKPENGYGIQSKADQDEIISWDDRRVWRGIETNFCRHHIQSGRCASHEVTHLHAGRFLYHGAYPLDVHRGEFGFIPQAVHAFITVERPRNAHSAKPTTGMRYRGAASPERGYFNTSIWYKDDPDFDLDDWPTHWEEPLKTDERRDPRYLFTSPRDGKADYNGPVRQMHVGEDIPDTDGDGVRDAYRRDGEHSDYGEGPFTRVYFTNEHVGSDEPAAYVGAPRDSNDYTPWNYIEIDGEHIGKSEYSIRVSADDEPQAHRGDKTHVGSMEGTVTGGTDDYTYPGTIVDAQFDVEIPQGVEVNHNPVSTYDLPDRPHIITIDGRPADSSASYDIQFTPQTDIRKTGATPKNVDKNASINYGDDIRLDGGVSVTGGVGNGVDAFVYSGSITSVKSEGAEVRVDGAVVEQSGVETETIEKTPETVIGSDELIERKINSGVTVGELIDSIDD